jgi:hypothetical protein
MNEMSIAILESTAVDIDSYINSMTKEELNETITRRDEIFDYIISDNTYFINENKDDDQEDRDNEDNNKEYYDEEDVSQILSN